MAGQDQVIGKMSNGEVPRLTCAYLKSLHLFAFISERIRLIIILTSVRRPLSRDNLTEDFGLEPKVPKAVSIFRSLPSRFRTSPVALFNLSRGFTLFELLAVIIILGGLLALVLPRFMDLTVSQLKSDAGRLATLTRYLHEASATKKLYYRMSFDLEKDTVSVAASPDGAEFLPESDPVLRGLRLSNGVGFTDMVVPGLGKVSSGVVEVFFSPSGSVEPFTVHISAGKNVKTLSFNPYSGQIKVEDGYL